VKEPRAEQALFMSSAELSVYCRPRGKGDPMEVAERSQSSQEDEKEGDDDVVGRMEIDDASDMTEVAGILLRLHVTPPPHPNTFGVNALNVWKTFLPSSVVGALHV